MNKPLATKSTLFEAVELINSGRIGQAEALCRAAVERNGDDVNMTALLGATLLKARKLAEAEKYLRHSMQPCRAGPTARGMKPSSTRRT